LLLIIGVFYTLNKYLLCITKSILCDFNDELLMYF